MGDISADISQRQHLGEVRSDVDPVQLSRLVVAAFDGLQLQWLYDKDVDMAAGLRTLIDVLLTPAG